MARALLLRGMLAGLVAGVLAFAFARVFGEPAVSTAISFESQRAAAEGASPAMALVSRDIQSTLGLLTAVVVYGVALGGLFAIVFTVVYGGVPAGLLVLPGVNEVPAGFPAGPLWNFRMASLGIQMIAWTTIGLLFGFLASRVMGGQSARRAAVGSPVHSA